MVAVRGHFRVGCPSWRQKTSSAGHEVLYVSLRDGTVSPAEMVRRRRRQNRAGLVERQCPGLLDLVPRTRFPGAWPRHACLQSAYSAADCR